MRLKRYDDPSAFASRAEPFLMAREAEHCLPIGIVRLLQDGERYSPLPPFLSLVEDDDGRVIQIALATPPHNLILSQIAPDAEATEDESVRLVARAAREALPGLSGVQGPVSLARLFAEHWETLTAQRARLDKHERIYRLDRVRPARPCDGEMRRATEADRPLLLEWLRAFSAEAFNVKDDPSVDALIERRLRVASSGMYLWQVGGTPVSLAGYAGSTPHGIRVGPVYTPPEARGHGYASALTAAVSQTLLDEGRQFVLLFTDLANPTSNHIYQEIGYVPVADVTSYLFEESSS